MPERERTGEGLPHGERLLTINEVASLLRVSRGSIYRLIASSDLTPIRVGRRARFSLSDVREYLDRSREGTAV
jgi:excisionase family DNA binding protein